MTYTGGGAFKRCIYRGTILRKATAADRVLHLLLVIHVLVRLHAVLGLVLLHAESADKGLGGGGVLVEEVPLEVAEVLDHLPAEQALVPISHLSDRQPSSKEKSSVRIGFGFMLYKKSQVLVFNIYFYFSNI